MSTPSSKSTILVSLNYLGVFIYLTVLSSSVLQNVWGWVRSISGMEEQLTHHELKIISLPSPFSSPPPSPPLPLPLPTPLPSLLPRFCLSSPFCSSGGFGAKLLSQSFQQNIIKGTFSATGPITNLFIWQINGPLRNFFLSFENLSKSLHGQKSM